MAQDSTETPRGQCLGRMTAKRISRFQQLLAADGLGDDMPLDEGMVIALEPGVYLPGIGGLRVEDDYLVTATGLERLSQSRRDLLI